jgi:mono/diheme cytochrome c family protein
MTAALVYLSACVLIFLLRWDLGQLWSAIGFFLATYFYMLWGFEPAAPASIVGLYMSVSLVALLLYVTSSDVAMESVWRPIRAIMITPSRKKSLIAMLVLVPTAVAWQSYKSAVPSGNAPASPRNVHPAPPSSMDVKAIDDTEAHTFSIVIDDSPIRHLEKSDPDKFAEHVANGKRVYYENCFFCHGDTLAGDGHYAVALNPRPANFVDKGTLPMLQEAFLYWRLAKGGPGLPAEGTPWDSSMPAWEKFISRADMWDTLAFLFEYTGYQPRAKDMMGHGDDEEEGGH